MMRNRFLEMKRNCEYFIRLGSLPHPQFFGKKRVKFDNSKKRKVLNICTSFPKCYGASKNLSSKLEIIYIQSVLKTPYHLILLCFSF